MALHHVALGLSCLQYFPIAKQEEENVKKQQEADNLNMAHPFEAIPMPYTDITSPTNSTSTTNKKKKRKNKKKVETTGVLLPKSKAEAVPTWQEPDRSDNESWNIHLKTLLYEKGCLIYAMLAEQEFIYGFYGSSLRYCKELVRCQKILRGLQFSSRHIIQTSCLLGRIGDCCCMIDKHWFKVQEYREQYQGPMHNFAMEMEQQVSNEDEIDDDSIDEFDSKFINIDK